MGKGVSAKVNTNKKKRLFRSDMLSPFLERKENKKYNKGEMKMKKVMMLLVAGLLLFGISKTGAIDYSGELSTYTVTGNTTSFATAYPTISGEVWIDRLVLVTTQTATSEGTAGILVSVYDNATSTTAASSEDGYWTVPAYSTHTTGTAGYAVYEYLFHNPRIYSNPAFFLKEAPSLGTDNVYIGIDYRNK
jgi:hypothetical protein